MEFNLLMLTRFEVTTMDSQEPTCTDNSYQCWTLNEVGVNSYLICYRSAKLNRGWINCFMLH